MDFYSSINRLLPVSFLLEQLLASGERGLTRADFTRYWHEDCLRVGRPFRLQRHTFISLLKSVRSLGFQVDYNPCNEHYVLRNAHLLQETPFMEKMIYCLRDFHFVDKYRTLGTAIQPQRFACGREFLFTIGTAMETHRKLAVVYHPFDGESTDILLHPYCLKQYNMRWYLMAYKEGNTHGLSSQMFALDRMEHVEVTGDEYTIPDDINPNTHFDEYHGIYVNDTIPLEHVVLRATAWASDYLNTLPLHHTQRDIKRMPDGRHLFTLDLRPAPDFVNQLFAFAEHIEVLEPQSLRDEMTRRASLLNKNYHGEEEAQ